MPLSYPEVLESAHWDRHKGAVAKMSGPTGVGEQLTLLQRRFEAVNWQRLDFASYAPDRMSHAELVAAEKQARAAYEGPGEVFRKELAKARTLLDRTHKDYAKHRLIPKKSTAVVADMLAAALELETQAKACSSTLTRLGAAINQRARAEAEAEDEDEPDSRLLDPLVLKRLLKLLEQQPERRVVFAFCTGSPDEQDHFVLHAKQKDSTKLYKLLLKETGAKAGTHGWARFDAPARTLQLQVARSAAGVVRKAVKPIKASGFKVRRIVLLDDAGTMLEALDDEADPAPEVPPSRAAQKAPAADAGRPAAAPDMAAPPEPARPAAAKLHRALAATLKDLGQQLATLPADLAALPALRQSLSDMVQALQGRGEALTPGHARQLVARTHDMKSQLATLRAAPLGARVQAAAARQRASVPVAVQRAHEAARREIQAVAAWVPPDSGLNAAALGDAVLRHFQRLMQPVQDTLADVAAGDRAAQARLDSHLTALRQALATDPVLLHLERPPAGLDSQGVTAVFRDVLETAADEMRASMAG